MSPEDRARFWDKVDTSGGPSACWPWTAAILATGYGGFKYQGRMRKAHRIARIRDRRTWAHVKEEAA